jgi:hypothetical protein
MGDGSKLIEVLDKVGMEKLACQNTIKSGAANNKGSNLTGDYRETTN